MARGKCLTLKLRKAATYPTFSSDLVHQRQSSN